MTDKLPGTESLTIAVNEWDGSVVIKLDGKEVAHFSNDQAAEFVRLWNGDPLCSLLGGELIPMALRDHVNDDTGEHKLKLARVKSEDLNAGDVIELKGGKSGTRIVRQFVIDRVKVFPYA